MTARLPDFLVVGAAKAGTTALHAYLGEHPDVFMSAVKETNYFAWEGDGTRTWLGREAGNVFPVRTRAGYETLFADAGTARAVGEASPLYLESPTAAARIAAELPDARIVVSLREPADRAWSAYMMTVRDGRETWRTDEAFAPDSHYVQVGYYHDKLKRYFDVFPRERIRVLLFDDLRADPATLMSGLFGFLGVDPDFRPALERMHNRGGFPRFKRLNALLGGAMRNEGLKRALPSRVVDAGRWLKNRNTAGRIPFPADLRARLTALYRDDVLRVQDLIGRDLSAWTTSCAD